MGKRFGVSYGAFSGEINVGKLSKDGKSFTDKEQATAEIVSAVADYVEQKLDGDGYFKVGDRRVEITVTEVE